MKIAIIGGTFDPIHDGHVAMARHVLKKRLADEVWFMVSRDTPLKDRMITPFQDRAQMVEYAIYGYNHMFVCTIENERAMRSYTIDTVRILKKRYPQHSFVWLIGNDQAVQLQAWKDIDELIKEIDFYVFPRLGEIITCDYPHRPMNMPLKDISSSEIRIGKKRSYVNKQVLCYINEQGLYMLEYAKSTMSEERFMHSERVAQVCVDLAKAHHVDIRKAFMAGILHDVCKEWTKPDLKRWMALLEPKHIEEAAPIWHGYVAAHWLPHALGLCDIEIRQAIYHHVLGKGTSKLAKILYISDKIEPGRGYDTSHQMAIAMKDLDAGVALIKQEQAQYITKRSK